MKNRYKNIQFISTVAFILLVSQIWSQSDQYIHLDRQDDHIVLDNGSQYIQGASQFSMAGWYYTDQLSYGQGMMGMRGSNGFYLIQLSDGIIECRYHNSTGFYEYVAPAFSIIPEQWQHIAWVYDGSKVELFIDGVPKGSVAAAGTFELSNVPFVIGKSILAGFNFVYGGRVDEVSLWTKALTQSEIQDMMMNELNGDEADLQLYYKCNQGVPGADNTSITHLKSETGAGERDMELLNFAMNGPTSNFNGTLDIGFQAITFPQIPNKLVSDPPFLLDASASSGLPVTYEIVSGPATVNGNEVTLTGVAGEVIIKASQPGDATYDPAEDLFNLFQVLDPQTHVPEIDARNPLEGDVFVPSLSRIQLAAISNIDYPELFSVDEVYFEINGESIEATDWENEHYTGWWNPPSYGSYTLNIVSTNNYGASAIKTVDINIVDTAQDTEVQAVSGVWLSSNNITETVEAELPSYLGAYNEIMANLEVTCPSGGCGEWDRVASIDIKGHNGQWVEVIRYITPYGTPCSHTSDVTDYMSLLQGKVSIRLNCSTLDNGYEYELNFSYTEGAPAHKYSTVDVLWWENYSFGDPANLQPVPVLNHDIPNNAAAATLKLVSTGHGWGNNNTGNAAEFHEDTHHIWVNGVQTFEQHNWADCNPNPDGCQPQNGTWFHDRAGWCPGDISSWFDYDMDAFINEGALELQYLFDQDYQDFCHPNNPSCISGVTCPNCDDGFNPFLIVACNLVTFSDAPLGVNTKDNFEENAPHFSVFPNPSTGLLNLEFREAANHLEIKVLNNLGQLVSSIKEQQFGLKSYQLDLSDFVKGMYLLEVKTAEGIGVEKVIIE